MKKRMKKLSLNRETLRHLQIDELHRAAGGATHELLTTCPCTEGCDTNATCGCSAGCSGGCTGSAEACTTGNTRELLSGCATNC